MRRQVADLTPGYLGKTIAVHNKDGAHMGRLNGYSIQPAAAIPGRTDLRATYTLNLDTGGVDALEDETLLLID